MKKVAGILAVTGTLLVVGFMVVAVLGFVAYQNIFPKTDKTEAPDTVGKYSLVKSFPVKGNIWGTEVQYGLEYEIEKSGKKDGFTYFLYKYRSESGAIEKFKSNECNRSELSKEGILKEKSGTPVGEFKYCGGTLYFRNKSRSVTIYNFTLSKYTATVSDEIIIDFVKNLPYNAELDMSGFSAAYPLKKTENRNDSSSDNDGVLSTSDLDKYKKSKSDLNQYKGKEITVRGYIFSKPIVPSSNTQGLAMLNESDTTMGASIACWFEKSDSEDFAKLTGEQYITVKGVFDGQSSHELNSCRLVRSE